MPEKVEDPAYQTRTIEDIKESCGIDSFDLIKTLATSDYGFFLEHVIGLNIESPLIDEAIEVTNNPPTQPGNKATKIAVMAPRGHSKTYSWTIGRALYVAWSQTNRRIILTSASRGQSKTILGKVKRIIERNEMLQHLKPTPEMKEKLKDTMDLEEDEGAWAAKSIITTTDVAMITKTFGSSIRNEHVDIVLCDDILTDENGSRSVQEEKETFYNVISPIVENKGGTLQVVGTPQTHNDLMMELMNKESYYTSRYRAYNPEDKEPLWPWMWTYEGLMNKKEEIGPARFAREYMTDPMSVEEQFFSYDDAVKPNLDKYLDGEGYWRKGVSNMEDWSFYVAVDIALSSKSGADYTVAQVIGVDPDGHAWHVDIRREQGMNPPEIADMLEELDNKYRFERGLVEKNAIGEGVWDTIRNRASLSGRIQSFDTTRKTRPEILSKLQAALHSNKLTLHDHDQTIDELLGFKKNNKGKLEGKGKDDCVMALAMCWKAARVGDISPTSMTIIGSDGSEIKVDEEDLEDEDIDSVEFEDDELGELGII